MNKTKLNRNVVSIMILMASLLVSQAQADIGAKQARILSAQNKILPLEQIITKVLAIKSGQIIEAELEEQDNGYSYELEILDENGIVWELEVDANTGELMEMKED